MTGFFALQATRGQWIIAGSGEAVCPVCGLKVVKWDYARISHLNKHLRAGWRPADPSLPVVPPPVSAEI